MKMSNDFQFRNKTISVKSTKWSHVCNKPAGGAQ